MSTNTPSTKIALSSALFLTVSISIVKGGATQWASLLWVAACCLTLCIFIVCDYLNKAPHNAIISIFKKPPFVFIVVFQIWTLAQSLTPISLDLPVSLEHSLIGIGMVCLIAIWFRASTHSSALNWLYTVLILFTFVQCIYGLAVMFSGINLILWMPKLHYLDRPTGFFVNANHFAAYLVLAIILMLSKRVLAATSLPTNHNRAGKHIALNVIDQIYNPANLVLVLLFATLVLTKSIGALVSLGAVLIVMVSQLTIQYGQFKKLLFAGLLTFLFIGLGFLSLDYTIVEKEIAGFSHTFWRRLALTQAASSMLSDHWLFGIGGGAFYSQFSEFRTLDVGNSYYNYAHNDLLQFWIEYGLIGVALLALFITAALRDNLKVLANSKSTMRLALGYTSIYGTIAVGVHSLVDFPMHIPGFSVLFISIISANSLYNTQRHSSNSIMHDN